MHTVVIETTLVITMTNRAALTIPAPAQNLLDVSLVANVAAKVASRIPFGAHDRDDHARICRACMERGQARYEYTQVGDLDDGGPLLLLRFYSCGGCGSTTFSNCTLAPAGSVLDAIVDRRSWYGRDVSGVHAIASLSVPEDAGRYALVGNLIDDAAALVRGAR